jgi:MFS family permease
VNISAAAASVKTHFALTNAKMGFIFSGFSWAYLASVLFGGWGARKFGAKSTLVVCVVVVGIGTIATGLAGGLITLFAARLVVGLGEGPAFPAATQAMRNWYPPDRFGYIQGITHSASRLGAALAPPPSSRLSSSGRTGEFPSSSAVSRRSSGPSSGGRRFGTIRGAIRAWTRSVSRVSRSLCRTRGLRRRYGF